MTEHQIGELFVRYEHYLRTVIGNRLYDGCPEDDLYDCLHDVFVIALKKKDDAKFNANPPGWLTVTAKRVIDNYNRKQTNRLRFHLTQFDIDLTQIHDPTDWLEEIVYRVEIENKILDKIMSHIRPDDRRLLAMRYEQQMSLDEIAAKTGLSKNALKVRLTRIKASTKELIYQYIGA